MFHSSGRCARGSHWPKSSRKEKIRSFARARSSSRRAPPNAASKPPCSIASSSVTVWSRLREVPGLDGSHSSMARPAAIESSTLATISVSPSSATRRSRDSSACRWSGALTRQEDSRPPPILAPKTDPDSAFLEAKPGQARTRTSGIAIRTRSGRPAEHFTRGALQPRSTSAAEHFTRGALQPRSTSAAEHFSRGGLIQGGCELAPRLARQRVPDPGLVEHAAHRAAQVLAAAVLGLRDRGDQRVEAALEVACVERRERVAQLLVLLEPQPGGEAGGGERAGEPVEDRQRGVALAPRGEDPRQSDAGVGASGLQLERAAQVRLGAGRHERVGLGRQQRVEEARDRRGRLRARELGFEAAVLERLDGRDALDPERRGETLVRVGVDLRERDPAAALLHRLLEHRRELPARPAPGGPEVDDHRQLAGALDDVPLEGLLGRVEGHASRLPGACPSSSSSAAGSSSQARRPARESPSCSCTGSPRRAATSSWDRARSSAAGTACSRTTRAAMGARAPPPRATTTATRRSPPTCSQCSTRAGSRPPCWRARRWARTRSCASRSTTATASLPWLSSLPHTRRMASTPTWRAGTRSPTACATAASRASSRPTAIPASRKPGATR